MQNFDHDSRIKNIEEITNVFTVAMKNQTEDELNNFLITLDSESDAYKYFQRLKVVSLDSEFATDFQGISFCPFVLKYCMISAAGSNHQVARFVLSIATEALVNFKNFLSLTGYGMIDSSDAPFTDEYLEIEQKRFFAFCIAQFIECGADFPDIFEIMRSSTLSQDSSFEIRKIIEEGPEAIFNSELFSEDEKQYWKKCLSENGTIDDWSGFQQYLVLKYKIPFLPREV